ncbi:MAG TPA: hypothetical protein VE913_00765, partial [Longimicrobium sp.]|nr:hypothetical protein [Longimicrobium sp.]
GAALRSSYGFEINDPSFDKVIERMKAIRATQPQIPAPQGGMPPQGQRPPQGMPPQGPPPQQAPPQPQAPAQP